MLRIFHLGDFFIEDFWVSSFDLAVAEFRIGVVLRKPNVDLADGAPKLVSHDVLDAVGAETVIA